MTATRDGGLLILGSSDIVSVMSIDMIKTDAQGKKAAWSRCFEETDFYNYGNAVKEIEDNLYVIGGARRIVGQKNDILLAKTSYNLYIDKMIITGPGSDWIQALTRTVDGGLVAVGQTESWGKGAFDVLLFRFDGWTNDR
jgi:hypothetical protein